MSTASALTWIRSQTAYSECRTALPALACESETTDLTSHYGKRTVDEIKAMEERGEIIVDRSWLDGKTTPSSLEISKASHIRREGLSNSSLLLGPSNNRGFLARNPLKAAALSQVKKIVHPLVRGNVDKLAKKNPPFAIREWRSKSGPQLHCSKLCD